MSSCSNHCLELRFFVMDVEWMAAPTSEELAAGHGLLRHHPRDRDHRQAAVVQLLRLHLLQLRRVRGLQAWSAARSPPSCAAGYCLLDYNRTTSTMPALRGIDFGRRGLCMQGV